jgi:hypothetical protein
MNSENLRGFAQCPKAVCGLCTTCLLTISASFNLWETKTFSTSFSTAEISSKAKLQHCGNSFWSPLFLKGGKVIRFWKFQYDFQLHWICFIQLFSPYLFKIHAWWSVPNLMVLIPVEIMRKSICVSAQTEFGFIWCEVQKISESVDLM